MELVLNEDQELIAKTAADFVAENSPISRVRELRDSADPLGFSRALWREMAELGWVGIPIDEAFGGAGMGLAELAIVLEALGKNLAPEPFLSTVLLGARILDRGGEEPQRREWLTAIAAGEKLLTLAYQEAGSRYDVCHCETEAEATAAGYRIRGEKQQVLDAAAADAIVVVARTAGRPAEREGLSLFLVPVGASGLEITPQKRVDSRAAATVRLDGVEVPASARIGEAGRAADLIEETATLEHLRERKQFDVPVGSFQALKHRAADLFVEIELAKSVVMAATRAIDEGSPDAARIVSLAKARCSDAYMLAANEAVQMFGGVGMTDEYDVGFYLKRARATELTFGDAAFHRDRWARLKGY
jgi:alkylation response protein AidB-like acyl-CoA dehydrogenase